MYTIAKPLFFKTISSLHAGSGDNLGVVDLPIQRERISGFPKIESSSLKGALREALESKLAIDLSTIDTPYAKIHRVFGYDEGGLDNNQENAIRNLFVDGNKTPARDFAGCLGFTDARLLLFPVKSAKGVFAWVTCPMVLQRFYNDLVRTIGDVNLDFMQALIGQKQGVCIENTDLAIQKTDQLYTLLLEEYSFDLTIESPFTHTEEKEEPVPGPLHEFTRWLVDHLGVDAGYWQDKITRDVVVLSDDDFTDFVQLSTEVITRIKINNQTGTVEDGGLFTEEYLPAESFLYSIVQAAPELNRVSNKAKGNMPADEVLDFFQTQLAPIIQLGGSASLGKGLLQTYKKLLAQ